MIRCLAALALFLGGSAGASAPQGLGDSLDRLAREGRFSGAIVIRGTEGVRFARAYGQSDPFRGIAFTLETRVDSASLAKPITAAAVLMLERDGKIDLDRPVQSYLPAYPHGQATLRHLLAHSAGLSFEEDETSLIGKDNAELLAAAGRMPPSFRPGSAFDYCNLCHPALALIVERRSGQHLLAFARRRLDLPASITIRPARLADWHGRAVGYRLDAAGKPVRFDSWDGELFYGSGNFSVTADALARWGMAWFRPPLATLRDRATRPARIAGKPSGLTLGNFYCSADRRQCHYTGHHQGFHNLLYWDSRSRIAVAFVSNNSLAPELQQRFQRAMVRFAHNRPGEARSELDRPLAGPAPRTGRYRLASGEILTLERGAGAMLRMVRRGIAYAAFPIAPAVRYAPGLDIYFVGTAAGGLHLVSLYEDEQAVPIAGD